jgi:hypothetical protein
MLVLTKHDESLSGQGMKRISDDNFRRRYQGIMSPFPIKEVSGQRRCVDFRAELTRFFH